MDWRILDSIPVFTLALPVLLLAGSWLFSRVLKLSLWATLLVGCSPFALPYIELPFSEEFVSSHPFYLLIGGWLLLICLTVGRKAISPALSGGVRGPGGAVRMTYGVLLAGALLVVALLVSRPELLQKVAPGWKGSAGLALLCVSLVSMSIALAKVVRSALIFSVWAFVSLVLASEVFLNKLPFAVVREDLQTLTPMISKLAESDISKRMSEFIPSAEAALRGVVISGSTATGYPLTKSSRLSSQLQEQLSRLGKRIQFSDLTIPGASIYQIREAVGALKESEKNGALLDVVVLAGWSPDAEKGANSLGLPNLTEYEALQKSSELEYLRKFPFVAEILQSTLYRYAKGILSSDQRSGDVHELKARVSATEYEATLREVVDALTALNTKVVLLPEVVISEIGAQDELYRDAMQRVANSSGALYIPLNETFSQEDYPYARGRILSEPGVSALSKMVINALSTTQFSGARADELSMLLKESAQSLLGQHYEIPLTASPGEAVRLLLDSSQVRSELVFNISMKEAGSRFYRVLFSVNSQYVGDKRLDTRDDTRVRFAVPKVARENALVDIALKIVPSPQLDEDRIGTTDTFVPTPLKVSIDSKGRSSIRVGAAEVFGSMRVTAISTETNLAVSIDGNSGEILSRIRTTDITDLNRWYLAQPWGAIVATTILGDASVLRENLAGLSYIGLGEQALKQKGLRVAVGVAGVKGERGVIKSDTAEIELSLGSELLKKYSVFTLKGVTTGSGPSSGTAPSTPSEIPATEQNSTT